MRARQDELPDLADHRAHQTAHGLATALAADRTTTTLRHYAPLRARSHGDDGQGLSEVRQYRPGRKGRVYCSARCSALRDSVARMTLF